LRRRTLHGGRGVDDLQDDRVRQLDRDDGPVEEHRADAAEAFLEIAAAAREIVVAERELLVRLRVHEVIPAVVLVEELDGPELDVRLVELVAAAEGLVEDLAGLEVPHLDLGERARAARRRRLHVHVEDHERFAVDLDADAALEVAGRDHDAGLPWATAAPKLAPAARRRLGISA
jgi:hypothetical protein